MELLVLNELDRITIVYADDPFSVDLARSAKKWANRFELETVSFEKFKKGTQDLEPLALQVKENDSQVLMVCGHLNEALNMSKALKNIRLANK